MRIIFRPKHVQSAALCTQWDCNKIVLITNRTVMLHYTDSIRVKTLPCSVHSWRKVHFSGKSQYVVGWWYQYNDNLSMYRPTLYKAYSGIIFFSLFPQAASCLQLWWEIQETSSKVQRLNVNSSVGVVELGFGSLFQNIMQPYIYYQLVPWTCLQEKTSCCWDKKRKYRIIRIF